MSLAEESGFLFPPIGLGIAIMEKPELSIIVCVDPSRCLNMRSGGLNSQELLREIQEQLTGQGLDGKVRATPCRCIFGCTYGPRIDVINRNTGKKILYGSVEGQVNISVRGRVDMQKTPDRLIDLAWEHLS